MTDLTKRLRDEHVSASRTEAANRIEELEAKLAEAVAGLRKIADYKHFSRDQGWIQITEARIASATLAKLEKKE